MISNELVSNVPYAKYKAEEERQLGLFKTRFVGSLFNLFSMDVLPLNRASMQGNRHVLVMQDCFSRFVEPIPLKNEQANEVARKIHDHLICRYGRQY